MASSLRQWLPRSSSLTTQCTRLPRSTQCLLRQRRPYSIAAPDASDPKLRAIDLSKLHVTKTTSPKELTSNNELVFGRYFTDHMVSLEWTATHGWLDPTITPYQNLSLDPATCVFHYAFEAFEGMKAYKDKTGQVRLFRPDMNMKRLNKSVARIALPTFEGEKVIELIKRFCQLEERFIPSFVPTSPYTHSHAPP
jgi:branched-chain amino acid aminotransferase